MMLLLIMIIFSVLCFQEQLWSSCIQCTEISYDVCMSVSRPNTVSQLIS